MKTAGVLLISAWMLAAFVFAAEFEHEYLPEVPPTESSPKWRFGGKARDALVETDHGKLKVSTTAEKIFHYSLGILETGSPAGDGLEGWDASSGASTVDFRLRCEGENPDAEAFILFVSDGEWNWRVSFYPGSVRVSRSDSSREIDTTRADTYRITLEGGKLHLSSASHGVLFKDVEGAGGFTRNRVLFGNFPSGENPPASRVEWELDFLRWTNKEANPEPPLN